VVIKNGEPICCKCSAALVYGDVRPRNIEGTAKTKRKKKSRKK
jgi:hypothetical protein